MSVLLINAPVEKIVEEYDAPRYPHIGLAYLATYLIKNSISCAVIDSRFERINLFNTLKRIETYKKEKKLIVGFTAMTHEIHRVSCVAAEIKKMLPQAVIVIGGAHVTALPEQTLNEFEVFDIGILGEGELTFKRLVEYLTNGMKFDCLDGVAYRSNGTVAYNPKTKWIDNLDAIGFPDWRLFPRAKEYPANIGRGCPIPCIFCMRASGTQSRFRTAENILEELTILKERYQPQMIHFFGDDFCADKDLTHTLLDGMIRNKLNLRWRAGMRISNIDMELLKKMKIAGCQHIEIGVESGNQEMLKTIRKGISLVKVQEVIKMAKKIKLDCWCYFILGHPNETKQTAMDTINFLCKINPTNAAVGIMVPYPGTQVWEMARQGEGGYRLLSTNWKDFNKQIGNALELKNLTRRQLESLQMLAYLKLFITNFRFIDLFKFLFRYRREGWGFLKNYIPRFFTAHVNYSNPS